MMASSTRGLLSPRSKPVLLVCDVQDRFRESPLILLDCGLTIRASNLRLRSDDEHDLENGQSGRGGLAVRRCSRIDIGSQLMDRPEGAEG